MALAVNTPSHLQKIGLLSKGQLDSNENVNLINGAKISKNDITYLFSKSLEKVIYWLCAHASHYHILEQQCNKYIYIYT